MKKDKKEFQAAEILCVGTELLLGEIVNTNAAYLSRGLAELGIPLYHQTVVGDNADRLACALRDALSRADLIVMTGGLGPTCDDLTKETVAEAFGLPLVFHAGKLSSNRKAARQIGMCSDGKPEKTGYGAGRR